MGSNPSVGIICSDGGMVDAVGLNPIGRKIVRVRVSLGVLYSHMYANWQRNLFERQVISGSTPLMCIIFSIL